MSEARSLLRERSAVQEEARTQADEILVGARTEADRMIAEAQVERSRLVSESELVDEAHRVSAEITQGAEAESRRMRDQTDDYVDGSLARFEQLLAASLETVGRGRDRIADSRAQAEQGYAGADDAQYADGEQLSWTPGATEQDYVAGEQLAEDYPAGGYPQPSAATTS